MSFVTPSCPKTRGWKMPWFKRDCDISSGTLSANQSEPYCWKMPWFKRDCDEFNLHIFRNRSEFFFCWKMPWFKRDCDKTDCSKSFKSSSFKLKDALIQKGLRPKCKNSSKNLLKVIFRWKMPWFKRDCDLNDYIFFFIFSAFYFKRLKDALIQKGLRPVEVSENYYFYAIGLKDALIQKGLRVLFKNTGISISATQSL